MNEFKDENNSGYISTINGSIISVKGLENEVRLNDLVKVSNHNILGQVIQIYSDHIIVQCFEPTYNLKLKEKVLELKNNLIDELKKDVYSLIEEKINKNYSNYVNFLIDAITNQSNIIDKPPKIILLFNSKDYTYFTKNPSKLKKLFKTPVEIKNSSDEMIGGFKAMLSGGNINYDYSINNLIE